MIKLLLFIFWIWIICDSIVHAVKLICYAIDSEEEKMTKPIYGLSKNLFIILTVTGLQQ